MLRERSKRFSEAFSRLEVGDKVIATVSTQYKSRRITGIVHSKNEHFLIVKNIKNIIVYFSVAGKVFTREDRENGSHVLHAQHPITLACIELDTICKVKKIMNE